MAEDIAGFDEDCKGQYFVKVRQFKNGRLEAVTRPIRPMQAFLFSQGYENRTAGFRHVPDVPVDPEEVERLADQKAQENHHRAVHRAKQSIRWLCNQMGADRLLTLTYRENVLDRDKVQADFKRFRRLLATSLKTPWVYVAVIERQDRGSYHIHCAVKGWQQISVIRRCWYMALGGRGDERGAETPGQVDVTSPRGSDGRSGRSWRTERLAGYITKYIQKTFDDYHDAEKKRYWHSRDVTLPVVDKIWLGSASSPEEAISETVSILQLMYGLHGATFDMWLSSDNTCFWLSGPCYL